ncbi:MAG: UDP-N-acetylglucosamine 1-carboxyvinyltransferase [Candidatus Paceibacter sp.]|jgi:UDP-N-acetylglucosamine 1-carboxyvinyltransferase|nr:UDP-N-acetylglucosamine 1-carboxyvinyltransferase [Candidatus Paceibacter sp.]
MPQAATLDPKPSADNSLSEIGKLISALRQERGITQEQFAKKLGTTQSAIARIERGEQNLSTEMLSKISDALNRDIVQVTKGALNIQIDGGHKLNGEIVTKTSKNGAVGLLAASLLNKGKTILKNVPRIEEVNRMVEVFESIGVSIKWDGNDLHIAPPGKVDLKKLDVKAAERTRAIIMLIGPLIHTYKKFKLPQPGGCKLGSRTVKPHLFALEKVGVQIDTKEKYYDIQAPELYPNEIVMYEAGDTTTENILMAAARIQGVTTIKFASANYMVQEVCFFLEKLGVKIEGIGTTTLVIHGVKDIDMDVTYELSEDPIDAMFFLASAIVTKSSITIKRAPIDFLELELLKLEKMGFKYKRSKVYKSLNGRTNLVDIKTAPSKLIALEEKIECRPYPGLNMDNLPFFAIIASQAQGRTLLHDWPYEKRAIYTKDIDKLGANTELVDPHRLYITGVTKLKPAEIICPPALRPAAILLIGMLAADGTSTLRNIYSINRGYEDIVGRLNSLGAKISILREF